MAKIINEELEINLKLSKEDGEVEVDCSAHYETDCEYGSLGRKGIPIELTPAQKTAIKNFARQVIDKVKEQEGIAS